MAGAGHETPLILSPAYKDYLWGGDKIITMFNRGVKLNPCAESWEASSREEGRSMIENGAYKGAYLNDLIKNCPELFGGEQCSQFPLLIKLIDANKHLSIQVHPNEDKAHLYQGESKSEMWYVIDAEPQSKIYLGLNENISKQSLQEAIREGSLEELMRAIEVKKGQIYYIPAGMLHAIGKGCLIYEVQQNSNTTYRLYDWGRKDKEGVARPLHIEEALDVMLENQIYEQSPKEIRLEKNESFDYQQLLNCSFFSFNKLILHSKFKPAAHKLFRVYFVLEGKVCLHSKSQKYELSTGQSFLVPAKHSNLDFASIGGSAVLLETIPNKV